MSTNQNTPIEDRVNSRMRQMAAAIQAKSLTRGLLVWDDSRIDECADLAGRAIIDFLESFDGPTTEQIWHLAGQVERLVRANLAEVR